MNDTLLFDRQQVTTKDTGRLLGLRKKILAQKKQKRDVDSLLEQWQKHYERSVERLQQRKALFPDVQLPSHLPIAQYESKVIQLLQDNQVVILAGETGSGKTTQLPKLCLKAGFGARGMVGHTQPRRVAATSVAGRIAEELNVPIGEQVGVSVRFLDKSNPNTLIKLMTDGMLLAEFQKDVFLSRYEVIIIDEAHERSINIDFLLGLLKNTLKKRPDLKVVITSATIDVERFSQFFHQAPVVQVEGRTFPVDIQYWVDDNDPDTQFDESELIQQAVKAAYQEGPGDILIFLPGEGEIRQTANALRKMQLPSTHILPLYARLSIGEQQKVFKPASGRKIVLATNVAETSLTVPGIRFVIDPGTARISRFNMRSKIQRLQIEKISQASANQRAGRCGRVSEGICYRLYSETDFTHRSEFTLPEIKRTNLASVILQMKSMGIQEPETFPLLESPTDKQWKDGQNLLFELGALDSQQKLTRVGHDIAQLPIDPKLAVMMLSGQPDASHEMLILASLYSVKDPRERPHDKQQKADQCHAQWNDKRSDFSTYLRMWTDLHKKQADMSNREFKTFCQNNFINFVSWLEWKNTYRQLKQLLKDKNIRINQNTASEEQIHRALIPALAGNIITKTTDVHFQGARNTKVFIHPSSVNFKQKPNWLIAGELMDTGKLYARATGLIQPEWIEEAVPHLVKKTYLDPHWRKNKGEACAYLQLSLFGLVFIQQRLVDYSKIEPELSRQWLIEKGLIDGEIKLNVPFHQRNQSLLDEYREEETRHRRSDILKSEEELFEWFNEKLPPFVVNQKTLIRWLKKQWHERNQRLTFGKEDIVNPTASLDEQAFPHQLNVRGSDIQLEYRFEPGHVDDGVSVILPLPMLNQFRPVDFEWLVPGLLQEKILGSIKGLPKAIRKNFIPAPDFANACFERMKNQFGEGDFYQTLSDHLYQLAGVRVEKDQWENLTLDNHLLPNFKVFGDSKQPLARGRDLLRVQEELSQSVKKALSAPQKDSQIAVSNPSAKGSTIEWKQWPEHATFLIERLQQGRHQQTRLLYALKDEGQCVAETLCESLFQAELIHRRGVARLLVLSQDKAVKYFIRSWQHRNEMKKLCTMVDSYPALVDDAAMAMAQSSIGESKVEKFREYQKLIETFSSDFSARMNDTLTTIFELLKQTRQVSRTVYESVEPKYLQSYLDIREQLDFLWRPGFLYDIGLEKLGDYHRYLAGLTKRLERMEVNFPGESASLKTFKLVKQRVMSIPEENHNKQYTKARKELLWMLEEYRLSLFAQGIKTAFPISEKRIEKQIDKLSSLR